MALYVGNTKYKVIVGNQKEDFKVPLPYDAEVDYLIGDGNAYIDTGIVGSSNLTLKIKCRYAKSASSLTAYGIFIGSRVARANAEYALLHTYQENFRFGSSNSNNFVNSQEQILIFDNTESANVMKVYNEANTLVTTLSTTYNSFNNNLNMFLFGLNNNGTPVITSGVPIYAVEFYVNSIKVRDFIPVRKDGVGYMYDKVSGQLFGNAGTGAFILGKDKTLPYDAEVEYLESTGNQYIDTGLQINYMSNVVVEERCRLAYTVTNVRQLNGSNGFGFWGCTADNKFECAGGSSAATSTSVGTGWHDVSWIYKCENSKGHIILYVDNTKIKDASGQNISSNYNYDIFIYAIGGRDDAAALFFCKEKIASYQIYFNNVLVRDYIPVRKDGVGYMYDKVSGTLFGNEGTGSFVIGPDKVPPYENTPINLLKAMGCVMWFPLKESGQLSDVIGGKSITISGTTIRYDSTSHNYYVIQGNANTTQGTISTGWTSDDFPDGEWTTVMMAKRNANSSYRGYGQIFLVNGAVAIACVNENNTGVTANWTDDNWHTCIMVCTPTGSKIYVDDVLVYDGSAIRQKPWGYATMTIGTYGSGYNNKYSLFKNALIFNKALSPSEVIRVRQLINQ